MPTKEEKKTEIAVVPLEFLQTLGKLGYPLADVVGKIVKIDRADDGFETRGFADANGRKEIALTFSREKFRAWIEDEYRLLSK